MYIQNNSECSNMNEVCHKHFTSYIMVLFYIHTFGKQVSVGLICQLKSVSQYQRLDECETY